MKKWLRLVSSFLLLVFLACLFLPTVSARADVNNFIIRSFDATYELSRDDPQGKLLITENIKLTFNDYNHGILRAIPETYGDDDANPEIVSVSRDGVRELFTSSSENHNLVLKIGEAARVITGDHEYQLKYSVENVIRFYEDHDELYWDINGDGWGQTFESVQAKVILPNDLEFKTDPAPICYTGYLGATEQNCTVTFDEHLADIKTNAPLLPQQTLTFVAALPKGYFVPTPLWQKVLRYAPLLLFVMLELIVVLSAFFKWLRFGKDYPSSPVIAVAFGPPKELDLLGSAYVYNDAIAPKAISASIIDLAVRGYIKIIETDDKGLLKKKTKYSLELLKPITDLSESEQVILNALFDVVSTGEVADLSSKKAKLYTKVDEISKLLSEVTNQKGMYELTPEKAKRMLGIQFLFIIGLIVLAFIGVSTLTPVPIVFGFTSLVILIILQTVMTKRSRLGASVKSELDGLKLYLAMAEKDRIAALQSANAPLALNAKEPKRDVKLFEKLLPYAILFGVEKTWAEAFKDLYTTPPDWYQGNWTTFNTAVFVSHIGNTMNTVNSTFTAPSSSGGSGFSGGGGSAGGGGGGGGGGGW